jgi:hypothetical protein
VQGRLRAAFFVGYTVCGMEKWRTWLWIAFALAAAAGLGSESRGDELLPPSALLLDRYPLTLIGPPLYARRSPPHRFRKLPKPERLTKDTAK